MQAYSRAGPGSRNSSASRVHGLFPLPRRGQRHSGQARRAPARCCDRGADVGVSAAGRTERSRPRRMLGACCRISSRSKRAVREHIPPTPWRRSLQNSASRLRRFDVPSRGTSCRPSSAGLVGSSRQTQSASGRARRTLATRRPAGAVPHSLLLPRRQAPRCARFSAGKPTRRAAEFAEVRDERREGNSGRG
jgi:hypothetical protein